MRLALLALLAAATPALGVDIGAGTPEDFLARSQADPGRLYALIVGATWCEPCHELIEELAQVPASTATSLGRAAWAKVDVDRDASFEAFTRAHGLGFDRAYPTVLALRGGRGVGFSTSGASLKRLEAFLNDAEFHVPPEAAPEIPSPLCPGAKDWADQTWGLSGLGGARDRTADFGLANLAAFRSGRLRAFAREGPKAAASGIPAPSETGVLYAPDALAGFRGRIEPIERSTYALAGLSKAPPKALRLVLTGHSGPKGMTVDFSTGYWSSQPALLTEPELTADVRAAREAGALVRGLVLTCYGGQYGEAFLPGADLAPACAAFATLPEKLAEGCYENGGASRRRDYLAEASRLRRCPQTLDGRRRHYEVVAATQGLDVPMLSSEHFLLFGPAASYLGRGEKAPAPPKGLAARKIGGGVSVYLDLVGGSVVRAVRDGVGLPLPRVSVTDCRQASGSGILSAADGKHLSFFYLRGRSVGPKPVDRADCVPRLRLDWDKDEEGDPPPSAVVDLSADYSDHNADYYDPTATWTEKMDPALGDPPQVDIRGLKPEARVLLREVIPAFAAPLKGRALLERLLAVAAELRPADSELARSLEELATVAREERLRFQRQIRGDRPAEESEPNWKEALAAATGASQPPPVRPNEPEEVYFTSSYLIEAMLFNIAPGEYAPDDVPLARLAHVAAVARAELALRAAARTEKKAQRLLKSFESLIACERGLY